MSDPTETNPLHKETFNCTLPDVMQALQPVTPPLQPIEAERVGLGGSDAVTNPLLRLACTPPHSDKEETDIRRVLDFINNTDMWVNPRYIANKLGIKGDKPEDKVRQYCWRLYKKLLIERPARGCWCYKQPHDPLSLQPLDSQHSVTYVDRSKVYTSGLLVQNVVCVADVSEVIPHDDIALYLVDSRVVVQFGVTTRRISYRVSSDNGLGIHGFEGVTQLVDSRLSPLGYSGLEWRVTNYELFLDGFRVAYGDGSGSIALQDFRGQLYKIYNKPYGFRVESRGSPGNLQLQDFMDAFAGRSTDLRVASELSDVRAELVQLRKDFDRYLVNPSQSGGLIRHE